MLRIEETERGAALHYEVRPFYSIVPLILPIVWLATGRRVEGCFTQYEQVLARFGIRDGSVRTLAYRLAPSLPTDDPPPPNAPSVGLRSWRRSAQSQRPHPQAR